MSEKYIILAAIVGAVSPFDNVTRETMVSVLDIV